MATRGLACLAAVMAFACVPLAARDAPQSASTTASAETAAKPAPRALSDTELATLQQRMTKDRARRADAHQRDLELAEQVRLEEERWAEQARIDAEELAAWQAANPGPNFGEVLLHGLNTLNSELANHQAQRAQQEAVMRDIERQASHIAEQRRREQQRERERIDEARRRDQAPRGQGSATTASNAPASDPARDAREARERNLREQAAAERLRLQQARTAPAASTSVASASAAAANAGPAAAVKPLRFVMYIGMRNLPGDTANSMCYSNIITRPGPPGWGGNGLLPQGSSAQAEQTIQAMRSTFIDRCRASGRDVSAENAFGYAWNLTASDEARLQDARAEHREDITVSL